MRDDLGAALQARKDMPEVAGAVAEARRSAAASLFKPAGSTPPINAQMRQFHEKKAAVRDASLKKRDWEEAERGAGCGTDEELSGAESRSEEARELDGKTAELERRLALLAAGSGKTVEEFVGEASGLDPGAVQAQIDRAADDYGAAQEEYRAEAEGLGAARERLKAMDGRATAALAAQEAQQILASLRDRVDRYLRVRLAAKVLRAEIERYRERSQGPVLRRASELFASVTQGRFGGRARQGLRGRKRPACPNALTRMDPRKSRRVCILTSDEECGGTDIGKVRIFESDLSKTARR